MTHHFLTRFALPAAGLVLLCSCAAPKKSPAGEAAPVAAATSKTPGAVAVRSVQPVSLVAQDVEVKAGEPSRAEEIARRVRPGTLVESGKDGLIFSLSHKPAASPGGLFEDAVVLSRLRGQLKKVAGLPESVRGCATVQSAQAYLKMNNDIAADIAARAIDTALKTDGITVVHVTTAPQVRL